MKISISTFLLVAFSGAALTAAEPSAKPVPPPGPLLSKPANFAKWEVRYLYPDDKPGETPAEAPPAGQMSISDQLTGSARMRRMVITFTKPYWRAQGVDLQGNRGEQWFDGVRQYIDRDEKEVQPGQTGGPLILSQGGFFQNVFDIGASGFPGMDWISAANFVGIQDYKGARCMFFKQGESTAWVTLQGRLPVESSDIYVTRTYRQLEPPTEMLTLPSRIAKMSAETAESQKKEKKRKRF